MPMSADVMRGFFEISQFSMNIYITDGANQSIWMHPYYSIIDSRLFQSLCYSDERTMQFSKPQVSPFTLKSQRHLLACLTVDKVQCSLFKLLVELEIRAF